MYAPDSLSTSLTSSSIFCWINIFIYTSNYECFPNLVVLLFCLLSMPVVRIFLKNYECWGHTQDLLSQNYCNLFSPHFDPNPKGLESVKSKEISRSWFWRETISRGWRLTFLPGGQLQSGWVPFISSVISITTPTTPKFFKIIILYDNWYFINFI